MTGGALDWWLEIGPLRESSYTGISQVTAALASEMLGQSVRTCKFFFGQTEIAPDIVAATLAQRSGEYLEWFLARAGGGPAGAGSARSAAIFVNRKTCRRHFLIETQIVHDLSALLTPQFHDRQTVDFHALSLRDDIHSNDLTFCVSEATREDVLRYLGPLDPVRVLTAHLGASISPDAAPAPAEPYVLVLGTIEPRKNIASVLAFLSAQSHLLERLRFVFLGRYGWGEPPEVLLERFDLRRFHETGRIVFPGYLPDAARDALLRHARLLIYPSLFEGFGLPVLEALACGTPCLTTRSSSIPEAGADACLYFDPFTEGDFARGFALALADPPSARARRIEVARRFSWSHFWQRIAGAVEQLTSSPTGSR